MAASSIDLMTLSVFKHVLTQRKVWRESVDAFGQVIDKYLQDEINKLEQRVDEKDTS
tara:strand:+ start:3843 stop:4013 length:171 start_codon:yes stop_codon:yes gene_type:complete